jgi:hypothetical protein
VQFVNDVSTNKNKQPANLDKVRKTLCMALHGVTEILKDDRG